VESIDLRRREVVVAGQKVPYHAVVSTMALPELLARISDLPDDIAGHASRLRCTTLRYLNVATRSPPRRRLALDLRAREDVCRSTASASTATPWPAWRRPGRRPSMWNWPTAGR
jgi:hypothetical protein